MHSKFLITDLNPQMKNRYSNIQMFKMAGATSKMEQNDLIPATWSSDYSIGKKKCH